MVPDRLIHIQKNGEKLEARLCGDLPSPVRYATLSHRWGSNPRLRLLRSNAAQLFDEIPMPSLEPVFQEAILVAWHLGLAHIWIDTLCIVQDSPLDWEAQSRNMGAIYMNAVFNIAAAVPVSRGLFTQRPPFVHFSPHLHIGWDDISLPSSDKPASLRGFYTLRDSARWYANVDSAHLNQRGWVSQERELSPCTLTFGPQQVYWKCGEVLACESFPNGVPGMEAYHALYTTRSFRDLVEDAATAEEIVRFWYGFAHRYSETDLTQKRDRLPAAFGMAQQLLRLMPGNRFLAGIFESHIVEGLLWRFDDTRSRSKPAATTVLTDFQVPSWSWASLDCPV
ncbi:heterokaryon incompatibility protein-domain-containing protein, partial [Cercophora newfieldiana]